MMRETNKPTEPDDKEEPARESRVPIRARLKDLAGSADRQAGADRAEPPTDTAHAPPPLHVPRNGLKDRIQTVGAGEEVHGDVEADAAQVHGLREGLKRLRDRTERVAPSTREADEGTLLSERPEIERELREGLDRVRGGLRTWGPDDQARAREWFGSSGDDVRERLVDVFDKIDANVHRIRIAPFESQISKAKRERLVAYVYPEHRLPDGGYRVHAGAIEGADSPPDTKAGILVHEMSHFVDIAETEDDEDHYGQPGSRQIAQTDPERALRTADNIEYFFEAYTPEEHRRAG